MATKNWISDLKKGGLHKTTGTPMGEKIPAKKIKAAEAKGGKAAKQARAAETLAKLRPKK